MTFPFPLPRARRRLERARATATVLEQINAEAQRRLLAGDTAGALAVLRSDGQPLAPCGRPFPVDDRICARPAGHGGACSDDPEYVDPPHECPRIPERLFVVVSHHRGADGDVAVLDLKGAYSDVDEANARARELGQDIVIGEPTETVDRHDRSLALTYPPNDSFAGLIEVIQLDLDPHLAEWADDVNRWEAQEYDPDYVRDLDRD